MGRFTHGSVLGSPYLLRTVLLASATVLIAWSAGTRPAFAHDDVEQALARGAGPPDWVYPLGAWAALALMPIIGFAALRRRWSDAAPATRYTPILGQLLAAWLVLGFIQSATARTTGTPALLYVVGKAVFLGTIATVWLFTRANLGGTLRLVLSQHRYRWLAVVVAVVVAALYLWMGNVIAPPEPDELPPPGSQAFVTGADLYGPLANWPAVEFWLPQLRIFGAPSIGTGLIISTIAALMGLSWATATYTARSQWQRNRGKNTKIRRLGGLSGLSVIGTSFCCCCAPAIYPVLALVFGATTASTISAWLLGSSSPFYNLSMVTIIAITLWALTSACDRIRELQTAPAAPHRWHPTGRARY